MAYDYKNAMRHDIRQWIEDNNFDGDEDELIDELWYADPVTGNLSGSYTFNRYTALEYVVENMDLCVEALTEFCTDNDTIAKKFMESAWEWFDVTIRCYLLSGVAAEVYKEMEGELCSNMA